VFIDIWRLAGKKIHSCLKNENIYLRERDEGGRMMQIEAREFFLSTNGLKCIFFFYLNWNRN
jgi:hypothetical protein